MTTNKTDDQTLLSVVVPCYNEEESLFRFLTELTTVFASMKKTWPKLRFEIVLIDDGSSDGTLSMIKKHVDGTLLADANDVLDRSEETVVQYISFSRNFGKEAALYAGLKNAHGDYVATMDADLQDPPALLPEMFGILMDPENDYDDVATRRVNRVGEPKIRSFFARCFYQIINRISDADIVDGARDYRLMRRSMVQAIVSIQERNRFSKGIFGWVGFKTKWLEFENVERIAGETKWSFFGLLRYSIEGIVAFSSAPLTLSSIAGVFLAFIALIFILVIFIRTLIFGDPVAGWPSTICVILLVGGLQLLSLGILGSYLSRTYTETKARPLYIVRECGSSSSQLSSEEI